MAETIPKQETFVVNKIDLSGFARQTMFRSLYARPQKTARERQAREQDIRGAQWLTSH